MWSSISKFCLQPDQLRENALQIWQCNAGISQVSGVTLDSLPAQESQVVPKALVQGLLMIIVRF